jgi:hypothetical protein
MNSVNNNMCQFAVVLHMYAVKMSGKQEDRSLGKSYSSKRRRINRSVAESWHWIINRCNVSEEQAVDVKLSALCGDEAADMESKSLMIHPNDDHSPRQYPSVDDLNEMSDSLSGFGDTAELDNVDCSSGFDTDPEIDGVDDVPIGDKLAGWAVAHNVTQLALKDLLIILRCYHPGLPSDSRTLLRTPHTYTVRKLVDQDGQYYHFGIACGIESLNQSDKLPGILRLQFNVDGLPLFKSSTTEFWPILCLIRGLQVRPFVVGLYCGKKKPVSLSDFLKDFIADLQNLLQQGITVNGMHFPVEIECFICDAPARAFLKNVKGHSGYYGCDKCTQEGTYLDGRMTFPLVNCPLRTDVAFCEMNDEDHHRGATPLSALNFGLVSGFALDYMHLVCLGVVRKLLNFWICGPINSNSTCASRLPAFLVRSLSDRLVQLSRFVPREFARKPRSLSEIDRWKAVEFRTFLLYTGPAVLPGILSENILNHFLLLSVAISLLANPKYCKTYSDYANQLLICFVEQSKVIYGATFVIYNVHALVHLAADVKRYGHLDTFSAFPFENQLQCLKRLVRKGALPLPQVVRRIAERRQFTLHSPSNWLPKSVSFKHFKGPIPVGFEGAQQYSQLQLPGLFLSLKEPDNCVSVDKSRPMLVRNILTLNGETWIVCEAFSFTSSFFTYPLPSGNIGIVSVSGHQAAQNVVPLNSAVRKRVRLPIGNSTTQFAVFPLVHDI